MLEDVNEHFINQREIIIICECLITKIYHVQRPDNLKEIRLICHV